MSGKFSLFTCALAIGVALLPAAALADDPRDPSMKSAAARARDSAETKRLNQGQLAYVRDRDARIMGDHRASQGEIDRDYANARADYSRRMAAWRRAVAACNAGQWDYCDK
ncbi:MAG TPA: hypothetical protein VGE65_03440 [Sphingobium sp.]